MRNIYSYLKFSIKLQEKEIFDYLFNSKRIEMVKSSVLLNESNLVDFAKEEIGLLQASTKEKGDNLLITEFIPEMLALIDKFGESGQSGGSAPYTANAITSTLKKLFMFEPIAPITGAMNEWGKSSFADDMYQNKRCFSLFKQGKEGKPYYGNAIVWKTQKDMTYSGTAYDKDGNKIGSSHYVKEFPFEPETFVIDVIEKEVAPDDWEFYIKNENQLKKVFEKYEMKKR